MRYKVDHLIYSTSDNLWNTFRVALGLTEPIDASILRAAVDRLSLRFPYFAVRLVRDGEELFYESNDEPFVISSEGRTVTLGSDESNGHLLAFAYKDNMLYIDATHFLVDGFGLFPMQKMLLFEYFHRLYPDESFDLSGIPQPGDEISPDELTDQPYPDEPVPCNPLGGRGAPEEVFKLDNMPKGYDRAGEWRAFRMKIPQSELMAYASSRDGSPATFISSLFYVAISELHPDNHLPVVCGMQHQFRKALGNLRSHSSHVCIIPIVYPDSLRGRDIELLNTLGRGSLVVNADIDHDALIVNKHIENAKRIESFSLDEKKDFTQQIVIDGIGKNTFGMSYTGKVDWSGLDRHIVSFSPYIDMNLSGGISVEIFVLGDDFDLNIMQRNDDDKYVKRVKSLLEEKGISCQLGHPEHFEICKIKGV